MSKQTHKPLGTLRGDIDLVMSHENLDTLFSRDAIGKENSPAKQYHRVIPNDNSNTVLNFHSKSKKPLTLNSHNYMDSDDSIKYLDSPIAAHYNSNPSIDSIGTIESNDNSQQENLLLAEEDNSNVEVMQNSNTIENVENVSTQTNGSINRIKNLNTTGSLDIKSTLFDDLDYFHLSTDRAFRSSLNRLERFTIKKINHTQKPFLLDMKSNNRLIQKRKLNSANLVNDIDLEFNSKFVHANQLNLEQGSFDSPFEQKDFKRNKKPDEEDNGIRRRNENEEIKGSEVVVEQTFHTTETESGELIQTINSLDIKVVEPLSLSPIHEKHKTQSPECTIKPNHKSQTSDHVLMNEFKECGNLENTNSSNDFNFPSNPLNSSPQAYQNIQEHTDLQTTTKKKNHFTHFSRALKNKFFVPDEFSPQNQENQNKNQQFSYSVNLLLIMELN